MWILLTTLASYSSSWSFLLCLSYFFMDGYVCMMDVEMWDLDGKNFFYAKQRAIFPWVEEKDGLRKPLSCCLLTFYLASTSWAGFRRFGGNLEERKSLEMKEEIMLNVQRDSVCVEGNMLHDNLFPYDVIDLDSGVLTMCWC